MGKASFVVDGFNLFHSVRSADKDYQADPAHDPSLACTKWLDIHSLFSSYLSAIGAAVGDHATMGDIHYFSAYAAHQLVHDPFTVVKQQVYISALESTGVKVTLGRFKKKPIWCDSCNYKNRRYEEKESDVAIAIRILEIALFNKADVIVVVSGDTDIAPALREVRLLMPAIKIVSLFPYARRNNELATLSDASIAMTKENYRNHIFPDPILLPNGSQITKPVTW